MDYRDLKGSAPGMRVEDGNLVIFFFINPSYCDSIWVMGSIYSCIAFMYISNSGNLGNPQASRRILLMRSQQWNWSRESFYFIPELQIIEKCSKNNKISNGIKTGVICRYLHLCSRYGHMLINCD